VDVRPYAIATSPCGRVPLPHGPAKHRLLYALHTGCSSSGGAVWWPHTLGSCHGGIASREVGEVGGGALLARLAGCSYRVNFPSASLCQHDAHGS
jgi:hypothetical protein